jgi:hypothetical protein
MRGFLHVDFTQDPPSVTGELHFDLADFPPRQPVSRRQAHEIEQEPPPLRNAGQDKSARATAARPKAKYDRKGNLIRATAD